MQDVHFEPRFQTLYDREKIAYSPAHAGTSPGHACEETYAVSPPFLTSDWWSKFTERSSNCLVDANYFR